MELVSERGSKLRSCYQIRALLGNSSCSNIVNLLTN